MRARLGYFLGVLLVAAGLYLAVGMGWALIVAGAATAAAFVWLYDVAEPPKEAPMRHRVGGDW